MPELGAVTRTLLGLARTGIDDRALAATICQACVAGLDVDGASISVFTGTEARQIVAASDATAALLEELQYTLNDGPCVVASTTGNPVFVSDIHEDAAGWPMFAAAIAEQMPIEALFALPLRCGAVNLGVLALYRRLPGPLTQAQRRDALDAADVAALMMLGRIDPDARPDNLPDGVVPGRAEVHQATGMVLVQLGVSAPEALVRLRAHAFVHGRLLIDVARDVVARRLSFAENAE